MTLGVARLARRFMRFAGVDAAVGVIATTAELVVERGTAPGTFSDSAGVVGGVPAGGGNAGRFRGSTWKTVGSPSRSPASRRMDRPRDPMTCPFAGPKSRQPAATSEEAA